MEIIWLDCVESTQKYLIDGLKDGNLKAPIAVGADMQTGGVGRRGDAWSHYDGNLALSFALSKNSMPQDMPLTTYALAAGFVLCKLLREMGSKCWMKWPNDLYIEDKKLAGVIAMLVKEDIVFGIGLNGANTSGIFAKSDVIFQPKELAKSYIFTLNSVANWGVLFREIDVEFQTHLNDLIALYKLNRHSKIELCFDGALMIDERKVYTLQ